MGIASGPHFEVASADLARWLDERAPGTWWSVDGDAVLTGRIAFPAPVSELADVLRRLGRPLLIADRHKSPEAKGQRITWEGLDAQVERLGNNIHRVHPDGPEPDWAANRFFWLSWKGTANREWMLVEDRETARAFEDVEEVVVPRD